MSTRHIEVSIREEIELKVFPKRREAKVGSCKQNIEEGWWGGGGALVRDASSGGRSGDLECVRVPYRFWSRGAILSTQTFFRGAIRLLEGQRHTESAILHATNGGGRL